MKEHFECTFELRHICYIRKSRPKRNTTSITVGLIFCCCQSQHPEHVCPCVCFYANQNEFLWEFLINVCYASKYNQILTKKTFTKRKHSKSKLSNKVKKMENILFVSLENQFCIKAQQLAIEENEKSDSSM